MNSVEENTTKRAYKSKTMATYHFLPISTVKSGPKPKMVQKKPKFCLKINEKSIFFIFCTIELKSVTNYPLIGSKKAIISYFSISSNFLRYLP